MQSWRLLQLESSALRKPDEFNAPARLATNGLHLPATLLRLAHKRAPMSTNGVPSDTSERTFAQIATRLSKLIDDLQTVRIDRDLQRELLTLYASGKDGTSHPARSLSDLSLIHI